MSERTARLSRRARRGKREEAGANRIDLCPHVQAFDQHALAVEEERVGRVSYEQVAAHIAKVVVQQHGVGGPDRALPDLVGDDRRVAVA